MPDFQGAVSIGQKKEPTQEAEPQETVQEPEEEDPKEAVRRGLPAKLHPAFDELTELQAANAELTEELGRYGVGLDPVSLIMTRISALVDSIWDGKTSRGQAKIIEMETRYETVMAGILADASKNVVKMMLSQGSNIPPALWKQMAKQSGLPEQPPN